MKRIKPFLRGLKRNWEYWLMERQLASIDRQRLEAMPIQKKIARNATNRFDGGLPTRVFAIKKAGVLEALKAWIKKDKFGQVDTFFKTGGYHLSFDPKSYVHLTKNPQEQRELAVADAHRHAKLYLELARRGIYPPGTAAFIYEGENKHPTIGLVVPKLEIFRRRADAKGEVIEKIRKKLNGISKIKELPPVLGTDIGDNVNWGVHESGEPYFFDSDLIDRRLTGKKLKELGLPDEYKFYYENRLPHDWNCPELNIQNLRETAETLKGARARERRLKSWG